MKPNSSNIREVMKHLALIQAMFEIELSVAETNLKEDWIRFRNFVISLVNGLVHNIIGLYVRLLTGYFKDGIHFWLGRIRKIKGPAKFEKFRECLPWEDFLSLIPDLFQRIMHKFNMYLKSFWDEVKGKTRDADDCAKKAKYIFELKFFISLFDDVIGFLKFWIECSEESEMDVRQKVDDSATPFIAGVPPKDSDMYNKLSGVIKKLQPFVRDKDQKIGDMDFIDREREFRDKMEPGRSNVFDYDGIRVLLTNFIGVSSDTVDRMFTRDADGNLECKQGFRPEEIEEIQNIFNNL